MNWKAVIFDLDGVICSTDEYHYRAWKELADSLGIPFSREENNRLRGISRMESLDILLENSSRSFTQQERLALAEHKNEVYRTLLLQMTPADVTQEVRKTLDQLRNRGILLAIGSSSKNAPLILQKIGLDNYFDAVADGNAIKKSKPDPEVFLKAADLLGVPPGNCLVVEDSVAGAEAAHAGGMQAACVGDAAHKQAGDFNLCSLGELLALVDETTTILTF